METINLLLTTEIGVATGVISLTLTRSRLLRGPRNWIKYRSPWWGELVTCPYCTSHWVAATLVGALGAHGVKEWLLSTTWAIAIASVASYAIWRAISEISPTHASTDPEELYAQDARS